MSQVSIHPSAVIDPGASLGDGVRVDPFAVIGDDVVVGEETWIGPHSVILGPARIGRGNRIYGQSSIGSEPQDLKYQGEKSLLRIGDENCIREFATINRGTAAAGNETVIGSGNLLMTGVHVGHDSSIGDGCILANSVTLAGHATIADHAIVSAFSGVHQFCRVGPRAFVGGYSVITRDALPFVKTVGERGRAKTYGINSVGLLRSGFSQETVDLLQKAYRILFRRKLRTQEAVERIRSELPPCEEVELLLRFIETSQRGFVR